MTEADNCLLKLTYEKPEKKLKTMKTMRSVQNVNKKLIWTTESLSDQYKQALYMRKSLKKYQNEEISVCACKERNIHRRFPSKWLIKTYAKITFTTKQQYNKNSHVN